MENTMYLPALLIATGQLSDAYLRYCAFRWQIPNETAHKLMRCLLLWSLACVPLYFLGLCLYGLTTAAYKSLLMLGWIPYLAISMCLLRHRIHQHIYVFGISAIWSFMQHNWSSIAVALFLSSASTQTVLLVHAGLYVVWFAVLFPWERRIFARILPYPKIFAELPLKNILAFFPLILLAPPLLMLADGELWHSWEERLSRLYLPLVFFLCYRYGISVARDFHGFARGKRKAELLREELASRKNETKSRERESVLLESRRGNILQDYRKLETLVETGRRQEAMALVERKEKELHSSILRKFSDAPMVNAAISLYMDKAAAAGIRFRQKVNLPRHLAVAESDLAVLISNLLENALTACSRERGEGREISLTIQHEGKKCVLSIVNPCARPLRLGEDGLPVAERPGHGTGMISLKLFQKKYRGYAAFAQKDGLVRLLMYWRDEPPC